MPAATTSSFWRSAHSIRELDLPLSLFDDLVSAFAQDITTTRYDSWSDVLDYCRRSANPVGRLVLRIGGYRDAGAGSIVGRALHRAAAREFLAGLRARLARRAAVRPADVRDAAGASEQDLGGRTADAAVGATRWPDASRRTRALFEQGRSVCDGVRGRLRLELRLTWLGGARILDRARRDLRSMLLDVRPTLGARDVPALLWQAARWRRVAA